MRLFDGFIDLHGERGMLRSRGASLYVDAYVEFHDIDNWLTWSPSQRWYAFPFRCLNV